MPEKRSPSTGPGVPHAAPGAGRRRGRPRRHEGPAVTRDAILAAALTSVRHNGLRGLALREVARRLGVSLATIQQHFRTRDDLWRACVDHVTGERLQQLTALPAPAPGDGPAGLLRQQLERATFSPGLTAAMWHDPEEGAADRLDYLEAKAKPVIEAGQGRVRAAIAAGIVRPVDPSVVMAIVGLGLSSLGDSDEALRRLFGIDLGDPDARERFAAALADILLNGLLVERRP